MSTTLDKVHRVLRWVGMDTHGDGQTVRDVIVGYAESGYGTNQSVVVLGNWNPKRFPRDGEPPLSKEENLPVRLAEMLERMGADIEWYDEWDSCTECKRAFRTEPDSYSWKPSYVETDEGKYCRDCVLTWGEDALADYVNDASRAVTWCEPSHLEKYGYAKWEPSDPHTYESGLHPGQDDDPRAILAAVKTQRPDSDVVFFLDESSQFYVRFSAYVRDRKSCHHSGGDCDCDTLAIEALS